MSKKYWVENVAGGCEHYSSRQAAMRAAATDEMNTPYIHSERGKRPAVRIYDDEHPDGEYLALGEYGESSDDLRSRMED